MNTPADLELTLRRHSADAYAAELRYTPPDSDADVRITQGGPFLARFDFADLRGLALDPDAYGQLLGRQLFSDARLQAAFAEARTNARTLESPLRVRLSIDPNAAELHALRWELLRDPQDHTCWSTGERVFFSRYLASSDWRRVHRHARSDLRALVVIANPSDLATYNLAPIDVAAELQRATAALNGIAVTALASDKQATLGCLSESLREGYDILYLVCHGSMIEGSARLWLEDESGKKDVVKGDALVERMNELDEPPRLVVLASCESAKMSEGDSPLAALGPLLAESGVAAVVAMQGNISMSTNARFMPTFFSELQRDGQIDRAVAAARGAVRENADAWMPALFMRLKSGALWYVPGFAGERPGFERWPALLNNIAQGRCTPILGFGVIERLLGSSRDMARRWAETHHYPMSPQEREDLPQVAEYLAVNQDENFLLDTFEQDLRQELRRRYPNDLNAVPHDAPLAEWLSAAGKARRAAGGTDAFNVLAALPFPLYITTNPDPLLADALRAVQRTPHVELCRWNEEADWPTSVHEEDPNYRPSKGEPEIYHLFGTLSLPETLVLTEDNYFDYLIGVTRNNELIPPVVRRQLADTALLFLGFQMDDWAFRVLFRSLMGQEGRTRRKKYAHVAVQIDPEGERILEPARARRYLERYFEGADISIYWGSTEDFLHELYARWCRQYPAGTNGASL